MIPVLSFVVIFSLLILVHELGHFLTAKATGVTVEEFGFGYPPRLIKFGEWRGTELTLNMLPFGGFVRMHEDDPDAPGGLSGRSRKVRALVFSAGSIANLILAIVLFTSLYLLGALTPVERPGAGIYYVSPGSPAQEAGIAVGDTILSIEGETVDDVSEAVALIQAGVGKPIQMSLSRDGRALDSITVIPRVNPPLGEGALGVALDLPLERRSYSLAEAVPMGFRTTINTVRAIYLSLRSALLGEVAFELSGPVGIYQHTAQAARSGLEDLIELTAMLSVNLFMLNLLPLPALDGGRLVFVLLEWIRGGRRIPAEKEGMVHLAGMAVLIVLMLAVTYADIRRLLG
ncbi:MAG: RIP metalloprotease RseP [Chloroflexi bacterium]|nr:RIP metalloprotease RseP [Chloroflexota bacterium]